MNRDYERITTCYHCKAFEEIGTDGNGHLRTIAKRVCRCPIEVLNAWLDDVEPHPCLDCEAVIETEAKRCKDCKKARDLAKHGERAARIRAERGTRRCPDCLCSLAGVAPNAVRCLTCSNNRRRQQSHDWNHRSDAA